MTLPITLSTIASLRTTLQPLHQKQKIALVATMGNLHAGHISLVKIAKEQADIVVVSIFVNPTQFGVGEDLESYPRTLEADTALLVREGVDYIFTPTVADMYPIMPPPTQVLAGSISRYLCGQSRPTHFDGVGLVISKLFNIVQPNLAVFGQKDYQQLAIVRQLVRDLSYDIDIIGAPIIRATDGLALSSRNQYLTDSERQIAPKLHQTVDALAQSLVDNEITDIADLQSRIEDTTATLNQAGFKVDYLEVLNQDLTPVIDMKKEVETQESIQKENQWVIVVAAWLGKARLLDNQEVVLASSE